MMLTTPATASVPYTADAPSFSTSTCLIIDTGIVFKSTVDAAPVPELIIRRPFTSTRVRCAPKPRRSTRALPPEPLLTAGLVIAPLAAVIFCRTPSMLDAPIALMSSAPIKVTGLDVSISVRLMREPVT